MRMLSLLLNLPPDKKNTKSSLQKSLEELFTIHKITLQDVIHELKAGLGISVFSLGRKRDDDMKSRDLQQIYGSPGSGVFIG